MATTGVAAVQSTSQPRAATTKPRSSRPPGERRLDSGPTMNRAVAMPRTSAETDAAATEAGAFVFARARGPMPRRSSRTRRRPRRPSPSSRARTRGGTGHARQGGPLDVRSTSHRPGPGQPEHEGADDRDREDLDRRHRRAPTESCCDESAERERRQEPDAGADRVPLRDGRRPGRARARTAPAGSRRS